MQSQNILLGTFILGVGCGVYFTYEIKRLF